MENQVEVSVSKEVCCDKSAMEDPASELFGGPIVEQVQKSTQRVDNPADAVGANIVEGTSTECKRADCAQKAIDCQEWERKYKELKKTYLSLTISYSEEHIKYKSLLKAATAATSLDNGNEVLADDGIFTVNEVKALQRIPIDKPKDSTFIMECLQYVYKNNPGELCHRTLKGTSEKVEFNEKGEEIKRQPAKNPLTPEKAARIKQLFIDRISNGGVSAAEHAERINEAYMNRLFASGIKNIAKKYP